jgi:hypothetical protein
MLAIVLLFLTHTASEMFIVITHLCLNYSLYFFSDTFWGYQNIFDFFFSKHPSEKAVLFSGTPYIEPIR